MACPGRSAAQSDEAWLPPLPAERSAAGRGGGAAKAARRVRGRREQQSQSSLPGLTRQSIRFAKVLTKKMDPRVKPAGDRRVGSRAATPALATLAPPSPRHSASKTRVNALKAGRGFTALRRVRILSLRRAR